MCDDTELLLQFSVHDFKTEKKFDARFAKLNSYKFTPKYLSIKIRFDYKYIYFS